MCLHIEGVFQPKWSDRIHQEWMEAVLRERPDLDWARLERTRLLMDLHAADAKVAEFAELERQVTGLPDPDDAHVVAVALASGAGEIMTFNLKDFPAWLKERHGVRARHPDTILDELLEENPGAFLEAVRQQRAGLRNPPKSVEEYLETLVQQGLPKVVQRIREAGSPI